KRSPFTTEARSTQSFISIFATLCLCGEKQIEESSSMSKKPLGIGFIGSGFIARFHIRSFVGVRDADVLGVWSPNRAHAEEAAALARSLRVGEARVCSSIESMVAAPEIDAIWICGPNHARIDNMERIVTTLRSGKGPLVGIACEKPLARNVKEARRM